MTRALAFRFGNPRNIMVCRLLLVAGPAEDLEVAGRVGAAKCQRDDVVDIPELTGCDLGAAGLALSLSS